MNTNRGLWMIARSRIRVAPLLFGTLALALGSAETQARTSSAIRYSCGGGQNILVERAPSGARVTVADRYYILERKASDLGQKYLSSTAALIIDGPSAVFVASDGTDLGNCTKAVPVASAH